jgi:glycolate oxidase iron-sulfur subunit
MFDYMDMNFDEPGEYVSSGFYIPDADECRRCGQCVSSCPTFKLFQIDEETPRGRLRTISKVLIDKVPISAEEHKHLNNCLQCRACETVCPSKMAYGQLFDQAQVQLQVVPNRLGKLALWFVENKRWRRRAMPLLWLYKKLGLHQPLRQSGLLQKLHLADAEALLKEPALENLNIRHPATGKQRGSVALFTGCIAEHFDHETLLAAIKVLNAIGYEVLVPQEQGCCGAIHQHNGHSATDLINNNIQVFNKLNVDAVLHTASGCGAMLSEYQTEDDEAVQQFRQRLFDINEFLLSRWPDDLQLAPANMRVAVHEPCSQRNVLKNQQAVYGLLQKIPGITVVPLVDNTFCCGAGGSYMLTHPANAKQLRDLKSHAINATQADHVISSNFGCTVFLNADAWHPVKLLYRQLSI